ncbi:hypothetical protein BDV30DRAFT_223262 [Aspergillus minisclerotigenes]|uniref:Major facilitator superfamily domain-containing protein n=1 Tax=Aspergillus minisclerotigenes TaxID=656917 RepID=A0A5N6JHW0_9EURO|nr:hypothetical protein BDV30DRAFT_223262 [Aspergillus minisclerotigenes]
MSTTEATASPSEPPEASSQRPSSGPWWKRVLKPSSTNDVDFNQDNVNYRSKSTLGILSDKETDEVPGTVLLLSSNRNEPLGLRHQPQRTSRSSLPSPYPPSRSSSRTSVRGRPSKKKTADGQIVLEPQPEDSMNDPLNWPVWRRDAALLSLGFYCLMGGGMTPILAAGFTQVADTYDVSTQQVAYTTGLYMLGLGVGSVIMSPTAILYGKRPVYLLGATLFVISGVWCALSPNYPSLVIARVFQGIAVSPVECLPSATIAEIYFLHERAYRVGIYTLLLLGGKNLIPLRLEDHAPEADTESALPKKSKKGHVGFVENPDAEGHSPDEKEAEADHDRVSIAPDVPGEDHVHFARDADPEKADGFLHPPAPVAFGSERASDLGVGRQAAISPARSDSLDPGAPMNGSMHYTNWLRERPQMPYLHYLRVWNGRISHDNWMRVAVRPFILFAYPAVLWSAVVYALSVGWLIVLSESVAKVYETRDTYNFTALQVGLVYISPFVGGLLGTAVAGKVSDVIVRYMTRRNGGVYEPEFRLVMAIPIALSTTAGLMGFGWSAQEKNAWIVPTVFFGIVSFGCCLGSTTSITFCVDSYRQYAGEALVTLNWSKNVFHGLIFSLFIVDWLNAQGTQTVYLALGGIQLGFLLFTIPMYIYGKRLRMWTVRKRLMEQW